MTPSTREQVTPAEYERWNDEMAVRYDPEQFYTHSSFIVRTIEHRRIRAVVSLTNAQAGERILEIGCGAGHILAQLPCGDLHGIDLSPTMLAKAKQRLGERARLIKANAESLPFPDASFDKIICSEVIEHLPDPERALAEMARILTPHGRVVISIPNEPFINALKRLLQQARLFNVLLNKRDGYRTSPKMDDEWHLQNFTLDRLLHATQPAFIPLKIAAIPSVLLPIRYVAAFRKKG